MRAIVCDNCQKVVEVKEECCVYRVRVTPYVDCERIDARRTIAKDLCRDCAEKLKTDYNIKEEN